jgi:glycosyltransferase involved in cell wall biosynthesis
MTEKGVAVILPALNEADCVETVVHGFLSEGVRVIVVDNGSTDGTQQIANRAGAEVVSEKLRGYGIACLTGLSYLKSKPPSIVVFADCDGTLNPHEINRLIAPIESGNADLVLGRRVRVERGALPTHQKLGNRVACILLGALYGLTLNDIPPYRALRWSFLDRLTLSEKTYGFPVETVAVAARLGCRIAEVDVDYRARLGGKSKVAGSIMASIRAGSTMVALLISIRFRRLGA